MVDFYGKLVGKYTIHGSYAWHFSDDILTTDFGRLGIEVWPSSLNKWRAKSFLFNFAISLLVDLQEPICEWGCVWSNEIHCFLATLTSSLVPDV